MSDQTAPGSGLPGARRYGHTHAEAYSLMQYESRDGLHREVIWNSRDGVTPFVMSCRCNPPVELLHVRWNEDQYAPDHVPLPGDRMFVDMTPEIAAEESKVYAARMWDDQRYPARLHGMWATVGDMAAYFAEEWCKVPGNPTVVTVPEPPKPEPRGHYCIVHDREHPEGWFDECVSEREHADAEAIAETFDPTRGAWRLSWWGKIRAVYRCARRGYHDWAEDGDTLGGIWIRCRDCHGLEEFLPGVHEPKGGEAAWQARLADARARSAG